MLARRTAPSPILVVGTSPGDPAGRALACGAGESAAESDVAPVGIAATGQDVYVAYTTSAATVIARVAP